MFIPIADYILRPKAERQAHLNLEEACVEIGGRSTNYRGLLAHHLGTTIPKGMKIHLCHACNNEKCSNPRHLYWGTAGENMDDSGVQKIAAFKKGRVPWNKGKRGVQDYSTRLNQYQR